MERTYKTYKANVVKEINRLSLVPLVVKNRGEGSIQDGYKEYQTPKEVAVQLLLDNGTEPDTFESYRARVIKHLYKGELPYINQYDDSIIEYAWEDGTEPENVAKYIRYGIISVLTQI